MNSFSLIQIVLASGLGATLVQAIAFFAVRNPNVRAVIIDLADCNAKFDQIVSLAAASGLTGTSKLDFYSKLLANFLAEQGIAGDANSAALSKLLLDLKNAETSILARLNNQPGAPGASTVPVQPVLVVIPDVAPVVAPVIAPVTDPVVAPVAS